jgi:hypothetical protein
MLFVDYLDPKLREMVDSACGREPFAELQFLAPKPPRPRPSLPVQMQEIRDDVPVVQEVHIDLGTGEETTRSLVPLECYRDVKDEIRREQLLRHTAEWDRAWITAVAVLAAFAAVVAIYRLVTA